jgi:chromosome segregation ATPase
VVGLARAIRRQRPDDPMLEQRVTRLEETLGRMEQRLNGIEAELNHLPKAADYASLKADIARIEGRLASIPTTVQMPVMLITTWSVGVGIVFAVLRFAPK